MPTFQPSATEQSKTFLLWANPFTFCSQRKNTWIWRVFCDKGADGNRMRFLALEYVTHEDIERWREFSIILGCKTEVFSGQNLKGEKKSFSIQVASTTSTFSSLRIGGCATVRLHLLTLKVCWELSKFMSSNTRSSIWISPACHFN